MPSGTALFGNANAGPGSTGGNKHLVEMRAGKMNMKGRMIYPDKRKGLLYVYQSEDSLMHFCWQDRSTGIVEDDLIIFPDDCEYVSVPQCTTGRVYLLKFKSSSRKFFFWLQEPSPDKDEENCKRINEILNNPASITQSGGGQEQDLQSLLNSMSHTQLVQLFGNGQMGGLSSLLGTIRGPGSGSARTSTTPAITHRNIPSTPTTPANTATTQSPAVTTPQNAQTTPATPNAPAPQRTIGRRSNNATASDNFLQPIQLSDLQSFLQDISPNVQQSVDLSTALTTESLNSVLSSPEALQQLQNHLPPVDGENAQESLRTTIASPQFQNAVSQFSSALQSGQLGPVVSQLSVNSEAVAAASQGNMQEFVKALEKSSESGDSTATKEKSEPSKGPSKKDDGKDDEKMQLD